MAPRILQYSDIENAYDTPDRIGRLAGVIADLRDPDTLVVGTGDNTAPGVLALVSEGEQALDFFRNINPDAETFGNHDFDFGPDRTRELVGASPQPWVSANVYENGRRFGTAEGANPWITLEVAGDRVGLFGVTDPDTASITRTTGDLEFTDPISAAETAVGALREQSVDHVVALSHLGSGDDELASAVDVDVILGGHVHSERVEQRDGTLLTRPGANGTALLEVTLGELPEATRHEVADGPLDETVRDTLQNRMASAGLDDVVAHVDEPVEWTGQSVYDGECRIGNFVADAFRWAADADVGLQNSGAIRSGPPLAGGVTLGHLASVVPFRAPVVVAAVSGDELCELLRQGDGALVEGGDESRWYTQISGARIVYDHAEKRLVEATVAGESIDPDQRYTIATTEYVLWSDRTVPDLTPAHRERTLDTRYQYEVLAVYAREEGVTPELDGRITRLNRAVTSE